MSGQPAAGADRPLVSAVISTYNMAEYLPQAIDSILTQSYAPVEVIVVDDGSTDGTPEVLERYADENRVRIVRQDNAGQEKARNRGIREARGEMVAFCDADDWWSRDKLSRLVPLLLQDPELGVAYGRASFVDAEGKTLWEGQVRNNGRSTLHQLLIDNFIPLNTTVVRRSALEEIGGFDESLTMGGDYDLWLRFAAHRPFAFVDTVVANVRVWGGQMSKKKEERFRNNIRIKQSFFERHSDRVESAWRRRVWAHFYVTRGNWRARNADWGAALADYRTAFAHRPWDRRLWRCVVRAACWRSGLKRPA